MSEPTAGLAPEMERGSVVAGDLLRVAARLFASHGYDATSVRAIVEAAGVTKPTLYYHFGSKQGVAEALLRWPHEAVVATIRRLVASEVDPVRLLRGTIEAHLRFCRDEPDCARFFFAILTSPENGSLAASMTASCDEMDAVMGDCLARLVALGLVDPGRTEALGRMLHGGILVATLDFLRSGRPLDLALADDLTRDLLAGFARPGFPLEDRP